MRVLSACVCVCGIFDIVTTKDECLENQNPNKRKLESSSPRRGGGRAGRRALRKADCVNQSKRKALRRP